jgi:carnitine O-acetyltransferase
VIDSALFVLVLDDFKAPDISKAAANMLHGTNTLIDKGDSFQQVGTCLNRWYDKLQLIVCADGLAGVNFEHAAIDGHTALRFVSDVVAETIISFAESITQPIYGKGSIPHALDAVVERAALALDERGRPLLDVVPKKLLFTVKPSIVTRIAYAEALLCDQMGANDTFVLEFIDYGKVSRVFAVSSGLG